MFPVSNRYAKVNVQGTAPGKTTEHMPKDHFASGRAGEKEISVLVTRYRIVKTMKIL